MNLKQTNKTKQSASRFLSLCATSKSCNTDIYRQSGRVQFGGWRHQIECALQHGTTLRDNSLISHESKLYLMELYYCTTFSISSSLFDVSLVLFFFISFSLFFLSFSLFFLSFLSFFLALYSFFPFLSFPFLFFYPSLLVLSQCLIVVEIRKSFSELQPNLLHAN